ncbi:MAG: hypothetical protein HYY52_04615 [Candidatus Melainabacteria bacterium]|nr:hypothetical protein [Candidatus Melainabacteria bacterium]
MKKQIKYKLDKIIDELSFFLHKDFSARFKTLTEKEDRQLFFLAKILTQLKQVSREASEDEKVVDFPLLTR